MSVGIGIIGDLDVGILIVPRCEADFILAPDGLELQGIA